MKKRLWIIMLTQLFVSITAVSQIQHPGSPLSNSVTLTPNIQTIKMAPVDVKALLLEDEKEARVKDIPYRFGYPFHTDLGINNSGSWDTLQDGRTIWRLKIQSDRAFSVNLIFDKFFIPPGGSMFVYNEDKSMVLGAFTEASNRPERVFSTAPIKGDRIIIEYNQLSSTAALPEIHISVVVHAYKDLFAKMVGSIGGFGSSGSCNINVNCPVGDEWLNRARSVAMVLLANNTRWCSGCLINNTRNDGTPYFLSANHCYVYSPTSDTWIFMFRYESPDCSNTDGPTTYTISGSTLMARNADSDFLLLRLSSTPSASYKPYYAGWNRQDVAATSGVGIHHPSGDIKKISFSNSSFTNYTWFGTPINSHWQVNWSAGVTEPGSSGSPIFDQDKRIVGQLHGGPSYCGASQLWDYYGKFSMSWNQGTTSSTRLKDWLDPDNTGAVTLNGKDALAPAVPQNVTISGSVGQHPTIAWSANSEPDLAGYKLRRKIDPDESYFSLIATLGTSQTSYTDPGVTIRTGGTGGQWAFYYVKAYDIDGFVSDPSNKVIKPVNYMPPKIESPESPGEMIAEATPKEFTLTQNYPNPFNPTTTIHFTLPQSGVVSLKVFDMLGREVETLVNEYRSAGAHQVNFNTSSLTSGVYFYRLESAGKTAIQKMLLLK